MNVNDSVVVMIDDNLGLMLNSAVRYALGRRTYIVSATCRYVTPLISKLSDRTILVMHRDIVEQEKLGYGDDCDRKDWMRLKKLLADELTGRGYTKFDSPTTFDEKYL